MAKKKDIINMTEHRYGMFMSEESNELSIMYGRTYLESDNVQEVFLYKIDVIETKAHKLYGQAKGKDKKFMPPIKLNIMISVEDGQQQYYGDSKGGIVRDDTGNLVFNVYIKELEEKKVEIDRGDIVKYNLSGYKDRYYEVENADNVTDKSSRTMGGFFTYWKKITAVPVKEDVIPFIDETSGSLL